jgi:cardiolipin synthase
VPTVSLAREARPAPPSCGKNKDLDWLWVAAIIALILQTGLLFLALFEPPLPYIVSNPRADPLASPQFLRTLTALSGGQLAENSRLEVFTDGKLYYPAELQAIRRARKSICLEAYIFESGEVTTQFIDALAERARAGVKVHVVVDAVGSVRLLAADVQRLEDAGAKFAWYMPLRWYTWPRLNNRTHRELLIIDGRIGFIGGSGWADQWIRPQNNDSRAWRDMMLRVEGPAVTGLQAAFTENWLEAAGEVLTGTDYFPFATGAGDSTALVVRSSPTTGASTPARILFQVLLASAKKRIHIMTPYFLPDDSVRDEIVRAIRERGVEVKIITPGPGTDHMLTRRSSRRLFGELLLAGARIYEYGPSMMHAKILLIDNLWAVVGSTNIDARSFLLNDEVNLATPDPRIAQRLEMDFQEDLKHSREVKYEEWKSRGIAERLHEWFGALLERQQ